MPNGTAALVTGGSRGIGAAVAKRLAAKADVSQPDDVARLFDQAEQAYGGVGVLVNSAGVMQLAPMAAWCEKRPPLGRPRMPVLL